MATTTRCHSGDVVRDVMLAAVENCFGDALKALEEIEWLTDNGSGYIAARTRTFAAELGTKTTDDASLQPAEQRHGGELREDDETDYIAFMPEPDAMTAVQNLAIVFEHYNEKHPHSTLKYRSPREYRRKTDSSTLA